MNGESYCNIPFFGVPKRSILMFAGGGGPQIRGPVFGVPTRRIPLFAGSEWKLCHLNPDLSGTASQKDGPVYL